MTETLIEQKSYTDSTPFAWILAAFWTLVIAASIGLNIRQLRTNTLESARIQARVAYEKDVIYRRWNAGHGGVYVPLSEDTQPNPYLIDFLDRDFTTPSGVILTLMNPAFMTRQVHELQQSEFGVLGHITSLDPIRPQNKADEWETSALLAFENGETEISSIETIDSMSYLRLMRPLVTEPECLSCHEGQGYQIGDIRGGISVAIPMEPLLRIQDSQNKVIWFGHLAVWGLVTIAIAIAKRRFDRSDQEKVKVEQALQALATTFTALSGDELFNNVAKHLVESLNFDYAFIGEIQQYGLSIQVVGAFGKEGGIEPFEYELAGTPCETVLGREPCFYLSSIQTLFPEDTALVEMGAQAYIGYPVFDSKGNPLGLITLLHCQPLQNGDVALSMLRIFSDRISAEIERARAEAEIRQTRREWQEIFQAIGHPTMILGPDYSILEVNRATEIAFGKSENELKGKKCNWIFDNANAPADCCPIDRLSADEGSTSEMLIEALNRTYLVSCTPMLNEVGQIEKIIHIATDISTQIATQKSLQKSEQNYILLADQLEQRVSDRTDELQTTINLMAGREVRMADLKKVILKLRHQLMESGLDPVANDPLVEDIE